MLLQPMTRTKPDTTVSTARKPKTGSSRLAMPRNACTPSERTWPRWPGSFPEVPGIRLSGVAARGLAGGRRRSHGR